MGIGMRVGWYWELVKGWKAKVFCKWLKGKVKLWCGCLQGIWPESGKLRTFIPKCNAGKDGKAKTAFPILLGHCRGFAGCREERQRQRHERTRGVRGTLRAMRSRDGSENGGVACSFLRAQRMTVGRWPGMADQWLIETKQN